MRIASLNSRRSSAFLIDSTLAPINSTPYFSRIPASARAIERFRPGLSADGREQRIGALLADDLFGELDRERLDVGAVGEFRVRHDRCRIGVDQDHFVTIGAQRLARLGPRSNRTRTPAR